MSGGGDGGGHAGGGHGGGAGDFTYAPAASGSAVVQSGGATADEAVNEVIEVLIEHGQAVVRVRLPAAEPIVIEEPKP